VTSLTWDNGTKEVSLNVSHWTTYRVQGGGPVLTITTPADGTVTDGSAAQVEGTAADPFGVSRVEIRVNGGSWAPASGTTLWNASVSLDPGENIIAVRGTNSLECSTTAGLRVICTVPAATMVRAGGAGGGYPAVTGTVTPKPPVPAQDTRMLTIISPDAMVAAYVSLPNTTDTRNVTFRFVPVDPSLVVLDSPNANATVLCAYALEPAGTVGDSPVRVVFADQEHGDGTVAVVVRDAHGSWAIRHHVFTGEGGLEVLSERFSAYALIRLPSGRSVALTPIPAPLPTENISGENPVPGTMPARTGTRYPWITWSVAMVVLVLIRKLRG
jgi:hypothetical protein